MGALLCLLGSAPAAAGTSRIYDSDSFLLLGYDRAPVETSRTFVAGPGVARFRLELEVHGEGGWPRGLSLSFDAVGRERVILRGPGWAQAGEGSGPTLWTPWFASDRVVIGVGTAGRSVELGALGAFLAIRRVEIEPASSPTSGTDVTLTTGDEVDGFLSDPPTAHRYRIDSRAGGRYLVYLRPIRFERRHRIEPRLEVRIPVEDRFDALRPRGSDTGIYWEFETERDGEVLLRLSAGRRGSYTLTVHEALRGVQAECRVALDVERALDARPAAAPARSVASDSRDANVWSRFSDPAATAQRAFLALDPHRAGGGLERLLTVASARLLEITRGGLRVEQVRVRRAPAEPAAAGRSTAAIGSDALRDPIGAALALASAWLEDELRDGRRRAGPLSGGDRRERALAAADRAPALGGRVPGAYQDVLEALAGRLRIRTAD